MSITRLAVNVWLFGAADTGVTVFNDIAGGWAVMDAEGRIVSRHGTKSEAFAAVMS
jgi:hypothetical protein